MSILCKLFGHIPAAGYRNDREGQYFRASGGNTDGILVQHWHLHARCRWCNQEYQVGMVHGPLNQKSWRR